jgi:hypothetical protein
LYHSTASLLPDGSVIVWVSFTVDLYFLIFTYARNRPRSAGSNPNLDVSTTKYATEYRVEVRIRNEHIHTTYMFIYTFRQYFRPPYMAMTRPSYTGTPTKINYRQTFQISVANPGNATTFTGNIDVWISEVSGTDWHL